MSGILTEMNNKRVHNTNGKSPKKVKLTQEIRDNINNNNIESNINAMNGNTDCDNEYEAELNDELMNDFINSQQFDQIITQTQNRHKKPVVNRNTGQQCSRQSSNQFNGSVNPPLNQPINHFSQLNIHSNHNSNAFIPSVPMIIDENSNNDVFNTNSVSNIELLDATQGRCKILESNNKRLEDDNRKMKILNIQSLKQKQHLVESHKYELERAQKEKESMIRFYEFELKQRTNTIASLSQRLAISPNLKIPSAQVFNDNRKKCPNFSQMIQKDFYAPLNPISPQRMSLGSSQMSYSPVPSLMVPDTQIQLNQNRINSQISSQMFSRPLLSSTLYPSQIEPTQVPQTNVVSNTQDLSQSSQNINWQTIKNSIHEKFDSNCELLKAYLITDQINDLFPNDLSQNFEQLTDWSISLNELSNEFGLKAINFDNLVLNTMITN